MRREGTYSGTYAPAVRGIPLIIVGVFWSFATGFALVNCLAIASRVAAGTEACLVPGLFVGLGIAFIVLGIVVVVSRPRSRPISTYTLPVPPPIVPTPPLPSSYPVAAPTVECRYCGTLVDASAPTCPSCGAPLSARTREDPYGRAA